MPTANFTKSRSKICRLMCKLESTYGTDSTPTPATDDVLIYDSPIVATVDATKIESRPHRGSFTTNVPAAFNEKMIRLRFKTRLMTSGTNGTIAVNGFAAIDALLSACGATTTAVAMTNIGVAPAAIASHESCTIWLDENGQTWKVTGCVGNCVISGSTSSFLEMEFDMIGRYADPIATSTIFNNWTGGTDRSKKFSAVSLAINDGGAYTPVASSIRHDFGVVTQRVPNVNDANGIDEFFVSDRQSTVTITMAHDLYASANITPHEWYTQWFGDGATTHAITYTLSSSTNAIAASFPKAQVVNVSKQDSNGLRNLVVQYDLIHTSTDEGEWAYTLGA